MSSPFLALALIVGYTLALLLGLLGTIVLVKMARGTIDLRMLIAEDDGSASLSRFQFLIFTFVIAMSLVLLVLANIEDKVIAFPKLDPGVMVLLGISGSSYVISKGIQKSFQVADKHADNARLAAIGRIPAEAPPKSWPAPASAKG